MMKAYPSRVILTVPSNSGRLFLMVFSAFLMEPPFLCLSFPPLLLLRLFAFIG